MWRGQNLFRYLPYELSTFHSIANGADDSHVNCVVDFSHLFAHNFRRRCCFIWSKSLRLKKKFFNIEEISKFIFEVAIQLDWAKKRKFCRIQFGTKRLFSLLYSSFVFESDSLGSEKFKERSFFVNFKPVWYVEVLCVLKQ